MNFTFVQPDFGHETRPEFYYTLSTNTSVDLFIGSTFIYDVFVDDEFYTRVEDDSYVENDITICHFYKIKLNQKFSKVTIRVQYLDNSLHVSHRQILKNNFVAIGNFIYDEWKAYNILGIECGVKINDKLSHQLKILNEETNEIPIRILDNFDKKCVHSKIKLMKNTLIKNPIITTNTTKNLNVELENSDIFNSILKKKHKYTHCDIYDLGKMGLYRICINTQNSGSCVIIYTQSNDLVQVSSKCNWRKVAIGDYIESGIDVVIPRTTGCRYIFIYYTNIAPNINIYYLNYPLIMKPAKKLDVKLKKAIVDTLVGCLDNGKLVDTPWRERAQWAGDVRIAISTLKKLSNNPEIANNCLHQFARTYNPSIGMISAISPYNEENLIIPTYHLQYCIAIVETYQKLASRPIILQNILTDTVQKWKKIYLKNGILRNVSGWHFMDWDDVDDETSSQSIKSVNAHCGLNCLWYKLCNLMQIKSEIDLKTFEDTFYIKDKGFKLMQNSTNVSFHASVMVATTNIGQKYKSIIRDVILQTIKFETTKNISKQNNFKFTPYFGFFIAYAMKRLGIDTNEFIQKFYKPMLDFSTTLCERYGHDSSNCHVWSTGIIDYI